MTDPIPFPAMPEEEDPQTLSREALLAQAQELRERIADLDAREPADMMSAQYERWAARHEALEDALDDILDLLDEKRKNGASRGGRTDFLFIVRRIPAGRSACASGCRPRARGSGKSRRPTGP